MTLVALIKLMRGIAQKQSYDTAYYAGLQRLDQRSMAGRYRSANRAWKLCQWTLLEPRGSDDPGRWLSYLPNLWRRSGDLVRYRRSLLVVMAVLVLVVIGIAFLRPSLLGALVVIGIAFLVSGWYKKR
jgi:Flp pilus assembly protein TadB